jgi:RHH-type rel operon transcriptional repressor/antitoxin RelB
MTGADSKWRLKLWRRGGEPRFNHPGNCYTCIAVIKRVNEMLAIRLPPEIETRLENLAKATGRSKTFYAREAIIEHLDDLEDIYLAERELEEIRAGRSRTYTLEEVERDLGLAD